MNTSPQWWRLVAAREVATRIRDKSFVVSTAILLLLVVGGIVAANVIGGGPPSYDVAVTDEAGTRLAAATQDQLRVQSGGDDAQVDVTKAPDVAAARTAVDEADVDAAMVPADNGFTIIGRDEVPAELSSATQSALALVALQANAQQAGTTVEELTQGSTLSEDTTRSGPVSADAAEGIAFTLALLFFVTAIGFGVAIAQSVVVEKENRIVEILAAAVPLRALLWGKVLGNSFLALVQVLVVTLGAVVALATVGDLEAVGEVGVAGVWFLAFFVAGFLALASLWSVAGSLATRQDDLQATTAPGQVLLMIPYLIAVVGSDRVIEIASFVPIASSMTMPGRLVDGDVPLWQPCVSLLLAAGAVVLLIRLGARWYEQTLLKTSHRTTYRELLRRS